MIVAGSIAEAQEWEYKLIEVQDWLAEKDILLTSHLEQELTVDDLPDESQVRATPRFLRQEQQPFFRHLSAHISHHN